MPDVKIDPNSGLPELPEGYFWRIEKHAFGINYLELHKKTWWGSSKKDERVLFYYDDHRNVLDPPTELNRAAQNILKEFHDPWRGLHGDYPPKKLGDA